MIFLGLDDTRKQEEVAKYCAANRIDRVFVLSPAMFRIEVPVPAEHIEWADIIEYKTYYALLADIGPNTLVVLNECLRVQSRHDLTYNCIRLFLQQTTHQIVFQFLPMIAEPEDFAILFDFDTRSRWKREKITPNLLKETQVSGVAHLPVFNAEMVDTSPATKKAYEAEKRKLIDNIGLKDPHTIPRNLYLMSGKAKVPYTSYRRSVGRNRRFKLDLLSTYKEGPFPVEPYLIFEYPHNHNDLATFMARTRQSQFSVLVADLKVDTWYHARYQAWATKIRELYQTLGMTC